MDDALRAAIAGLPPDLRDTLRRVLVSDQADRDEIAAQLLRYRDPAGDVAAEIVDMLTLHPEARRTVVRILAEVDATEH